MTGIGWRVLPERPQVVNRYAAEVRQALNRMLDDTEDTNEILVQADAVVGLTSALRVMLEREREERGRESLQLVVPPIEVGR